VAPGSPPLERCTPKIADFGLAKSLDAASSLAAAGPRTQSGTVLGTPGYMAPEQAAGKTREGGRPAGGYAPGAAPHGTLTAHPPFRGETMLETLMRVMKEDPAPPRRLRPQVPRDLETICLKCLEKDPARRYPSAQELAEDLRRFLAGEPIAARR